MVFFGKFFLKNNIIFISEIVRIGVYFKATFKRVKKKTFLIFVVCSFDREFFGNESFT